MAAGGAGVASSHPALIDFTWVPGGSMAPTGSLLLAVVALPSCPLVPSPQARTTPFVVRARLWKQPAARSHGPGRQAFHDHGGSARPRHAGSSVLKPARARGHCAEGWLISGA
jgi:hypothetical protein